MSSVRERPGTSGSVGNASLLTLANGTVLNVVDEGDGAPIVLMHGWTADVHFWDDLAPRLVADGWRVIRYDLRGHGRSPVRGPYDFEELSADLECLIAELQLERPVLAGLSLGGFLSMIHAIRHPGTLRAVVLADTWTGPVPSDAEICETLPDVDSGPQELARWWAERRGGGATAVERDPALSAKRDRFASLSAAGIRHAIEACRDRASVHDGLGAIDVPALVIAGEDEQVFLPAMHADMAARIPHGQLMVIRGAGHHSATDAPEDFAAIVRGFLTGLRHPPGEGREFPGDESISGEQ